MSGCKAGGSGERVICNGFEVSLGDDENARNKLCQLHNSANMLTTAASHVSNEWI